MCPEHKQEIITRHPPTPGGGSPDLAATLTCFLFSLILSAVIMLCFSLQGVGE